MVSRASLTFVSMYSICDTRTAFIIYSIFIIWYINPTQTCPQLKRRGGGEWLRSASTRSPLAILRSRYRQVFSWAKCRQVSSWMLLEFTHPHTHIHTDKIKIRLTKSVDEAFQLSSNYLFGIYAQATWICIKQVIEIFSASIMHLEAHKLDLSSSFLP